MKKLIAGLLVVLMVFALVACGRGVPDFEDWHTRQLGSMTVRFPTDRIVEETVVEEGLEVVTFEGSLTGASVIAMQMRDMATLLRDLGMPEADIAGTVLHGVLHGGVEGMLAEAGGEVRGESEGTANGIRYFSVYGVTEIDSAAFESRAFLYGDHFYLVTIIWTDANADVVTPFFQSIQFGA